MGEQGVDAGFDTIDYNYALPSSTNSVVSRNERTLWCAVIHQAFVDMLPLAVPGKRTVRSWGRAEQMTEPPNGNVSKAALKWLLYNHRDFTYVCLQAGVSPSVIRRAAMLLAKRHGLLPEPQQPNPTQES